LPLRHPVFEQFAQVKKSAFWGNQKNFGVY